MWWIICVAVVVILYFFIHFKIRNEVNEIEAITERTKTFVIMGNESNEIDVSKDLSISPSCNFQINGNGLMGKKIQNLEISRTNSIKVLKEKGTQCQLIGSSTLVPIEKDLQKERNKSLNKVNNIDFGIIKNKEDMNCFRNPGRFRQKFKGVEIDSAAIVSRRYRYIKLTKNMSAPKPLTYPSAKANGILLNASTD